jgi:hypothetical protein
MAASLLDENPQSLLQSALFARRKLRAARDGLSAIDDNCGQDVDTVKVKDVACREKRNVPFRHVAPPLFSRTVVFWDGVFGGAWWKANVRRLDCMCAVKSMMGSEWSIGT